MNALATIVDAEALLDTVLASLVAGIGVTLIFSIAIYGVARFAEAGREGRAGACLAFGALGVVAALAFVAVIAIGIIVMTTK